MHKHNRTMSMASKHEIYLVGEQIRYQMRAQGLIRDRRHRLRGYKSCFVGRDAVDWLIKSRHVHTPEAAIAGLQKLVENFVLHHVVDEHPFKNEHLFYRFRRDDDTYLKDKDLKIFYLGYSIYQRMRSGAEYTLRPHRVNGNLHEETFTGREMTSWLVHHGEAKTREAATALARDLLQNDVIRHVTDDHHFYDDETLRYQFCQDMQRPYLLSDLLRQQSPRPTPQARSVSPDTDTASAPGSLQDTPLSGSVQSVTSGRSDLSSQSDVSFSCPAQSPSPSPTPTSTSTPLPRPPSPACQELTSSVDRPVTPSISPVLLRPTSVEELEDKETPFVRRKLKILSDDVGFGFVVRGEGPTYIQTVDPLGPAAAAGLKVRQFVYSVNGTNALRMNHRAVGRLIMTSGSSVLVEVLTHRREELL